MTFDQAESRELVRELARTIANGEQATGLLRAIGFPLSRRGVKTVVLNACESLGVALAGTSKLDFSIAMDGPIGDAEAIEFSRGFYDALGEGREVPEAFDEGVSCCKLKRLPTKAVLLRKGNGPGR